MKELNNNERMLLILSRIRKRRMDFGYTQEFLAKKLKISQNAYSKIELGYTNLTVSTMYDIADILDIDVFDLLNNIPKRYM